MFELRNKARKMTQSELDVTQYFNSLTKLWQELDLFNSNQWSCLDDAERYRKMVNKERIYDFLADRKSTL